MSSTKRLGKELKTLLGNLPAGIHSVTPDETNLLHWKGLLAPQNKPYDKAAFKFELDFPEQYPFKAPKLTFKTPVYHPNVDEKGDICMGVLQADNWKPATKVANVLEALVQLFNEPEASHPLRDEIANEYLKEKEKFEENAAKHAAEHGEKRP
eukprot:m.334674 g.334674  ORF g.334674 m.334674 type:complete len:153 (+) comp17409_c0_seq1:138-596(+)